MSFRLVTAGGQVGEAIRPHADEVLQIADEMVHGRMRFPVGPPAPMSRGWDDDNSDWVLPFLTGNWNGGRWNDPARRIAQDLYRRNRSSLLIVIEAYKTKVRLSDGRVLAYELTTDGATWYPDEPMLGNFVRSWWAVPHDLMFDLNHAGAASIFGRHFSFEDSYEHIRSCSLAQGDWMLKRFAKVRATSSRVAERMWDGKKSVAQIKLARLGLPDVSVVPA